ncbi:Protein CBG22889 [Caenorhabditis briggsae]|uniref:Protein CBG22889 n=1 Tax=Caenorhabditis briggsae TaxID=6238 RepID=A8Y3B1_CAEBR|nr:Protein CBG22889 [Caenorhabditis briggsae]CAP39380.1 Protein CBG22889 [Caenorhabditis briggsae]
MNVSFCLQKNRENNRKTKVKSKKPKFRKTLEEALLLYFQKKIFIFLYVDWALRKNAIQNEDGKSSGTVVTSKQQSTSSSAHRHRLRQKWTKREAPMPFQPVRQQRKRII